MRKRIELTKTIILFVLVCLSLFLTFQLWNYKPDGEKQHSESTYVSEVDLGGVELTKNKLIQPQTVVFHGQDELHGFPEADNLRSFYKEFQDWTFDDYKVRSADNIEFITEYVEVQFITDLPAEMLKYMFNLSDDDLSFPDWNFDRMYMLLDDVDSNVHVYFPDVDNEKFMTFVVHDTEAYKEVRSHLYDGEELIPYVQLAEDKSIYLPAEKVEMKRSSMSVKTIEPMDLVNALFRNPSLVSPNVGEAYFTDGQRGMRVKHEGKSMEFINPIVPGEEEAEYIDLLDLTIEDINEHKGWTDNYILDDMKEINNTLSFRMEYEGYPMHSNGNLTIMEQSWHDNQLHQYVRPLFSLNNILGVESVELPSGEQVLQYINSSSTYNEDDIRDIHIGYRLTYLDGTTFSVTLDPAWYINYKGVWQEIRADDIKSYEEEGE